tara:strand:+ start:460 stop:690 length:231 start_codon:yes stop_codon:yes gene_type:complete
MESEDRLLWNRAFDKFDSLEEKIQKLCINTASTQEKIDSHLKEQEKKGQRKERVFYVVIAAMASVFSLFTFVKDQI